MNVFEKTENDVEQKFATKRFLQKQSVQAVPKLHMEAVATKKSLRNGIQWNENDKYTHITFLAACISII